MKKINFAFWGTPDVASRTLEILKVSGYLPSLIITSPDKPAGRGLKMTPTPVSIWAEENNIPCLKPEKITPEFIKNLSLSPVGPVINLNFDLYIVVAYGKILPETLINIPELGTINIHYSLLPKWRGASPLETALLNGDIITGVSIQQMAYKLDSGPILTEKEISIDEKISKEELRNKLIGMGGELLCEILAKIKNKSIIPKIQDESKATYCSKINKNDGELDIINGNQKDNYNKYRAFYGWPGTYFFTTKNDKKIRIKIKDASYEDGKFIIKKVTPEGKKEISYEDFLRQN
jgi:methionyl-tRNA formyltransferase